jgi:glycosyltransferase involved in cell wall biosynthesis
MFGTGAAASARYEGLVRFSAVITCYNYREYVCDAVDSALAQTLPPCEVVVVNDGSTDDSLARLTDRFAAAPSVRVLTQENAGQLAAFANGCSVATGDVVCFLDADDLWEPNYLRELDSLYGRHDPPDMVLSNLRRFGNAEGIWHRRPEDEDLGLAVLTAWFLRTIPQAPTSSISLRRRLALRVLDLPESVRADWRTRADDCLIIGAQILGARTLALAQPHVRYRVHAANNWAQQPLTKLATARYKLSISTLADAYAARAGLTPRLLGYAYLEFRTRPSVTWQDLATYLWLQWRAPQPFFFMPRPVASMLKHYLHAWRGSGPQ